jgi:hypothetical protein
VPEKFHDFLPADRLLEDTHVELPGPSDATDGREVVVVERGSKLRCLPTGSPGPNRSGKLVKTGLIDEHHGSILSLGFF